MAATCYNGSQPIKQVNQSSKSVLTGACSPNEANPERPASFTVDLTPQKRFLFVHLVSSVRAPFVTVPCLQIVTPNPKQIRFIELDWQSGAICRCFPPDEALTVVGAAIMVPNI